MAVAFNLTKFDPSDKKNFIFQGDATIEKDIIRLTRVDEHGNPLGSRVGRVLRSEIVQLYEGDDLRTSFETTFVFRISAPRHKFIPGPGDGLAFFLATTATQIPPKSHGKYLGLFNNAADKVVAVEFDTYSNPEIGDPCYRHIGIDINSAKSSAVARWNWKDGAIVTATVTYNSACEKLTVVAVSDSDCGNPVTLSYDVDLTTVLPEQVRVGLSASTGQFSEKTEVLSWSFESN